MIDTLNTKTKLLFSFMFFGLFCTIHPIVTVYYIARSTIEKKSFDALSSTRAEKKEQIENYFLGIKNQVYTIAQEESTRRATREFERGFKQLERDIETQTIAKESLNSLITYYDKEFISRLKKNQNNVSDPASYVNQLSNASKYLQYLYLVDNPNPVGKKINLDKANDNSTYSNIHSIYHPIMKRYLETFGFYDIFLVDAESGTIIYSASKEIDYSTNLLHGPFKDSNLARAFRSSQQTNEKNFTYLVDFEAYEPSHGAPASFISAPIFDGDKKIGVLIFQLPIDEINNVMTSHGKWKEAGLQNTGESYLIGPDRTMRSTSRFIIEHPFDFFKDLEKVGLPSALVDRMKKLSTTILTLKIETDSATNALQGETGTLRVKDYRGVEVLSSFSPVNIPNVKWGIISEIDAEEVFEPVIALTKTSLIVGFFTIIAMILLAFLLTRFIMRPFAEVGKFLKQRIEEEPKNLQLRLNATRENQVEGITLGINSLLIDWQKLVMEVAHFADKLSSIKTTLARWDTEHFRLHENVADHVNEIKLLSGKTYKNSEQASKTIDRQETMLNQHAEFIHVFELFIVELSFITELIKSQAHETAGHNVVLKIDTALFNLEKHINDYSLVNNNLDQIKNLLLDSRTLLSLTDNSHFIVELSSKIKNLSNKISLDKLRFQELYTNYKSSLLDLRKFEDSTRADLGALIEKFLLLEGALQSMSANISDLVKALEEIIEEQKSRTKKYIW